MAKKNPDIQAACDRRAKLRVIADEQLIAVCGGKPFWVVSDGWGIEVDGFTYTPEPPDAEGKVYLAYQALTRKV